ncbi:uncharacterized protein LOC127595813 [Hippocampus zosterae]|uniref:uncharacterized protein LOC127595813 n=1 Tax=Hippocampus zosterae TaxID=109293 RepID=UPI00223D1B36|nr:uncharacterized protein LOC127595813 [Hippocampus zosterae]
MAEQLKGVASNQNSQAVALTALKAQLEPFRAWHKPSRDDLLIMPRVTRLLLLFALVGVAVMSSITRSPSARAGPVRVVGADVAKMSSYSASGQYPPPSSGRPWSQLQNTKGVFPSRQRGGDYEAILPERKVPADGLLARQGDNLDRYRVVVLKSAPGHPLRRSSGHPEKEAAAALRFAGMPVGDAPQRLARRRDQAGGQSAWKTPSVVWSQPGRYVSGSREDADGPTEAFTPRRANVIQPPAEENPDASLFQHGPQPEKPTWSDDARRATKSVLVKSSFLRREDLGKAWRSPPMSELEEFGRIPKYSRTVSAEEKERAVHLPPNAGRHPATWREPFPPHSAAQSYREKLWVDAVAPPAPATDTVGATASGRPVRPTPWQRAGRFAASQRSKWPASKAFAGVPATGRGRSYGMKMANAYPPLSSKYTFGRRKVELRTTAAPSAIALRFAGTSPIPQTFATERNERRTTPARDGGTGRMYVALRGGPETVAGNSPIVRRPQVPLPTSPETTLQSPKNTENAEESSASEVFDHETLQEDLLELNYLRISMGNVSFKSI